MIRRLFFITALFYNLDTFSQSFAPIGATWHYGEGEVFAPPGYENYVVVSVIKDTLIQNRPSKEISSGWFCWHPAGSQYVSISSDSVFLFDSALDSFKTIYTFNAVEGDELFIPVKDWENGWIDTVIVHTDSVDEISVNGIMLGRQFVTYSVRYFNTEWNQNFEYSSKIIENIGDVNFIFNFPAQASWICDANYSKGLRCYEDEFYGHYETGISPECTSIFVNTEEENEAAFTYFPNPTTGKVNFSKPLNEFIRISIVDFSGKSVPFTYTDQEIDIENAGDGIFVVQAITMAGNILTFKVIKQGRWF